MMLTLLLSIAIFALALLMLRHVYLRWRHEHLNHRSPQRELPCAAWVAAP
jgi:hypothetical protein